MWGSLFRKPKIPVAPSMIPAASGIEKASSILPTTSRSEEAPFMLPATTDVNKIGNIVSLQTDFYLGEVNPQLNNIINRLDFSISTEKRDVAYKVTDLLYYIIIHSNNIDSVKLYLEKVRESWDKIMINFPQLFERLEDGKMSERDGLKAQNVDPNIIELLHTFESEQDSSRASGRNSITFSQQALNSGQKAADAGMNRWTSVHSHSIMENANKEFYNMAAKIQAEKTEEIEKTNKNIQNMLERSMAKSSNSMKGFEGGMKKRIVKKKSRRTRKRAKTVRR